MLQQCLEMYFNSLTERDNEALKDMHQKENSYITRKQTKMM